MHIFRRGLTTLKRQKVSFKPQHQGPQQQLQRLQQLQQLQRPAPELEPEAAMPQDLFRPLFIDLFAGYQPLGWHNVPPVEEPGQDEPEGPQEPGDQEEPEDEDSSWARLLPYPVGIVGLLIAVKGKEALDKQQSAADDETAITAWADQVTANISQHKAESEPEESEPLSRSERAIRHARIAQYIYALDASKREDGVQPVPQLPDGVQLIDALTDTETGLGAAVVYDNKLGYVLVFRGSRGAPDPTKTDAFWQDWVGNNALQGMGIFSPQYRQAACLGEHLAGIDSITGHSLAGGLAQAASAKSSVSAVTFQAAGLHSAVLEKLETTDAELKARVTNYFSKPDPVNLANQNLYPGAQKIAEEVILIASHDPDVPLQRSSSMAELRQIFNPIESKADNIELTKGSTGTGDDHKMEVILNMLAQNQQTIDQPV